MRFGIRDVANITFKAKANGTKIGNRIFEKDEPVILFDTAKTSSLEGNSTAVYAQGGRGNPKLITWEGEKEMTFTFEDALISPTGMSILMGAGLLEAEKFNHHILVKTIAVKGEDEAISLDLSDEVAEIAGEDAVLLTKEANKDASLFVFATDVNGSEMKSKVADVKVEGNTITGEALEEGAYYMVDAYVEVEGTSLEVSADKFSDYFYIEAETLFRNEADGVDKAAQIIIPKGKVQSNFNISMANTGDPSTFTFTVDAMADYTKFDKAQKVLTTINVLD